MQIKPEKKARYPMELKQINILNVSRGINIAFRMKAAEDVTRLIEDGIILLSYRDNYTTYFMKVLKEIGIEIETWARPYLCTDRYVNEKQYISFCIVRKDHDTPSWSFLKRTAGLKRIQI
jgi:hypothetical protein